MAELKIFDVRTATREELEASFKFEREWILAQAWQLMVDVASANDNRCPDNPIDLNFDGLQENLERLMKSNERCPYFEMRKFREENGWL